ncbi:M48 family metallopeptidase [Seonamhaeicola sp. ML3]|uniref:tetratricopeptide repeat protein n=1 Tax=Seonamhaeicola sp. ML3 TaxID=2937786 RepID=UPI002010A29F|nr:hypothetical protein [Seonamhaeicola sp. ML3]
MKNVIIMAVLLITGLGQSQSNYEKGMNKAFELWGQGNPTEAANLFERIANVEQDNWLPSYYVAQINVIYSFGEKDKDKLTSKLKKAQDFINDATAISKNNPEIMVLQALLYTAWVAHDGATYGMTMSPKVTEIYAKAKAINPNNPRVVYCETEWNMGAAKFFGQDTAPFCKDLEKALELFANFKAETQFHPSWGKDRVESLLNSCGQ